MEWPVIPCLHNRDGSVIHIYVTLYIGPVTKNNQSLPAGNSRATQGAAALLMWQCNQYIASLGILKNLMVIYRMALW